MRQYLDLLEKVMKEGNDRGDRTGTGTRSLFGEQIKISMNNQTGPFFFTPTRDSYSFSWPLLTTKRLHTKSIIHELLWMLSGSTDVKYLQENGVTIWDEWATEEQCAKFNRPAGDLGPVYGHQWRNFGATKSNVFDKQGMYRNDGLDQISEVLRSLKENPFGRRHIVTGWNPQEADQVALPPCHTLFQFYVTERDNPKRFPSPSSFKNYELHCQLYQRSADLFLGVPFNIASYTLLMAMICQQLTDESHKWYMGTFTHTFGDVHIYNNHREQVFEQLNRTPNLPPTMHINGKDTGNLFGYKYDDFQLADNYFPWKGIKAEVSV